jgi:hypothetical protein
MDTTKGPITMADDNLSPHERRIYGTAANRDRSRRIDIAAAALSLLDFDASRAAIDVASRMSHMLPRPEREDRLAHLLGQDVPTRAVIGAGEVARNVDRVCDELDRAELRKQQAEVNQLLSEGNAATGGEMAKGSGLLRSHRFTRENVERAFRYQAWNIEQQQQGELVRGVLAAAARAIVEVVPPNPLQTRCLNLLFDARMLADAAITFPEGF